MDFASRGLNGYNRVIFNTICELRFYGLVFYFHLVFMKIFISIIYYPTNLKSLRFKLREAIRAEIQKTKF